MILQMPDAFALARSFRFFADYRLHYFDVHPTMLLRPIFARRHAEFSPSLLSTYAIIFAIISIFSYAFFHAISMTPVALHPHQRSRSGR